MHCFRGNSPRDALDLISLISHFVLRIELSLSILNVLVQSLDEHVNTPVPVSMITLLEQDKLDRTVLGLTET